MRPGHHGSQSDPSRHWPLPLEIDYASPMVAERLYYEDPWLWSFEARVTGHVRHDGRAALLLDRSAFYPESGGQLADRGTLGDARLLDAQVAPDGEVLHFVEGELPAPGTTLRGVIDGPRRRVHMAQHTGQHLLSRALEITVGATTLSARLGETACTLDLDAADLTLDRARQAELVVQALIDDDVPVRAYFPDPGELAALALRRAAKVSDHVRVIQVGEFDVTPCGGTHCTRTGQIGLVHVTGLERHKGGTRLTFVAGRRARDRLVAEAEVLRALAADLTCASEDVPIAVDKLRRQVQHAREAQGALQARLADLEAEALLAAATLQGEQRVLALVAGATPELLRSLADRITARAGWLALLGAATPEGTHVLAARSADSAVDCGALVKSLATTLGGRGGGRPERAEGRLPGGVDLVGEARRALGS